MSLLISESPPTESGLVVFVLFRGVLGAFQASTMELFARIVPVF